LLRAELEAVILHMKKNKSPGADNVTAEKLEAAVEGGAWMS